MFEAWSLSLKKLKKWIYEFEFLSPQEIQLCNCMFQNTKNNVQIINVMKLLSK